jgi:hypothetical protein
MSSKSSWLTAISGAVAISACAPSSASLVAYGLTYTLLESTPTSTTEQFTLEISGINGPGDAEGGGRYGVADFAFNQPNPANTSVKGGSLAGFTFVMGGLNASGCNMQGDFYCFENNSTPSSVLPANSQLSFTFDVTVGSASDWTGYNPNFKIDWAGTNSYNLVSQKLSPTIVPLPAALPLFLGGLASLGFMRRRRAV